MSNPSTGASTPYGGTSLAGHLTSVSSMAGSLYRRLTDTSTPPRSHSASRSIGRAPTPPGSDMPNGVFTPPYRTASPFQPPPLTPLSLNGDDPDTRVLSKAIAEEIRLLVPPRLQLAETWNLVYSLEHHGVSLATLYHRCAQPKLSRNHGFVLVIQDASGGVFGAYLTDPPHPTPSFYGTGECFLWRASVISQLSDLPLPPSADTSHVTRSTTISGTGSSLSPTTSRSSHDYGNGHNHMGNGSASTQRGFLQNQGDSIRFKAFPYSGINDYLIHCESDFLSVGGGDGKYGLWLDGVLERGISSAGSLTFGNEALSEEGEKFEVVGVEIWAVGGS